MKGIVIYCLIFVATLVLPVKEVRAQQDEHAQVMREMARIRYVRARNYYHNAEYLKAKVELGKVLELAPNHQGALWYLNCVEKELDSQKKACGSRKAKLAKLEKQEKLAEIEVALSAAEGTEDNQGQRERTEEISTLYEKGKDYFSRGLYSEAIACFEKIVKLTQQP